jgi:hypothetical protein
MRIDDTIDIRGVTVNMKRFNDRFRAYKFFHHLLGYAQEHDLDIPHPDKIEKRATRKPRYMAPVIAKRLADNEPAPNKETPSYQHDLSAIDGISETSGIASTNTSPPGN